MTAADIANIATTVFIMQVLCDLATQTFLFQRKSYQLSVQNFERAQSKLDRERKALEEKQRAAAANSSNSSTKAVEKMAKRLQQAENEHGETAAKVAYSHNFGLMITSVVFFFVLRVMGMDLQGKIIAILPFTPWKFAQRLTARGLEFNKELSFEPTSEKVNDLGQAASFVRLV